MDEQTDGQICYINIARQYRAIKINGGVQCRRCLTKYRMQLYTVSEKVYPLTFDGKLL